MLRITLLGIAFLSCMSVTSADEAVDYTKQIKPILLHRCYACHGALKQEAELRLDTAALARKGGDSGVAIVPGKADASLLIERITSDDEDLRMPSEGEPLSAEQIALLKRWIAGGAVAPADEKPEEDPRKHWAFQKPLRSPLPAVKNPAWQRNPIDAFIAAAHEKHGLKPTVPAPRHVLLRRVYIDLIGLPPTRGQLHAFLADDSADAYEKVVKRLLASPQYGERWGRHWMDVWRYSDWYGRRSVNDVRNSFPHIWRWRDWIVRSLNDDKGYDRMIVEMLAGDEVAPGDDETVVATGFIARNWFSLNYDQWMKDMVEHTGKAFLAIRMNCAHCHDHKYDPISQEEYFKFRAFFEPLEMRQDRVPGGGDLPKFIKYVPSSSGSLKPIPAGLVRIFDENLTAKTYMYRLGDTRDRMDRSPIEHPAAPAILGGDKLKIEPVTLSPVAYYPGLRPFVAQEEITQRLSTLKTATAALAQAKQSSAAGEVALAESRLTDAQAQLTAVKTRIAAEKEKYFGDAKNATEMARRAGKAQRDAALTAAKAKLAEAQKTLLDSQQKAAADPKLQAVVKKAQAALKAANKAVAAAEKAAATSSDTYTPLSPLYPTKSTGRRTALARWIANRQNPLTARVAVNHIWMRHFGRPLVESVFDFGRSGTRPSHPELLDHLAVELMESGWSMKRLHHLIVTSKTYRMHSSVAAGNPNLTIDKDNRWLWHFQVRRAEAEAIRDGVLHLAGQLDGRLGGQDINGKLGPTTRRRSLYYSVYPEDGGQLQLVGMFDAPSPIDCYRRTDSIVPQQALALTNSRLTLQQGRLLARGLWNEITDEVKDKSAQPSAFVVAAFEHILSRAPTTLEQQLCQAFLAKQAQLFQSVDPKQLKSTGGKNPVSASSDPAERSRESLVRSLLNHNDFVTIR